MKHIYNILHAFSLSFVLAGALVVATMTARANDTSPFDDNRDKIKKTEEKVSLSAMPKANLSLDANFRFTGNMNAGIRLSDNNTNWNFKSVMTIKRGNATYVLPYATQIQQPSNMNMNFHHLQIVLPLKRN
jgi:hypothetical protein